jgi:type III secretion protein C
MLLAVLPAHAQDVDALPLAGREVSITAREEPLGSFLENFFGQAGLLVVVSQNARGSVNGVFQGDAAEVFDDVRRAFNLVAFYDGVAVHVAPASDVTSRTFAVDPDVGERMRIVVDELALRGVGNVVRISNSGVVTATGDPRFLDQISAIAAAESRAATERLPPPGFRVYQLRYAWAQDVTVTFGGQEVLVPGVASIVRSLVEDNAGADSPRGPRTQLLPATADVVQSLDDDDEPYDPYADPYAREAPPEEPLEGALISSSRARIEADARLNAVVVRDEPERLPLYGELISALDHEPHLLEIRATIVDVRADEALDLGIDFRLADEDDESSIMFGSGDAGDRRLRPDRDITSQVDGFALSTVVGESTYFATRITALEQLGAARVVSRPQVLTLSNVEAVFDNSRTFFVRVAGEREVDLFNISSGTTLRVTPHVVEGDSQRLIRLLVEVVDGRLTGEEVDDIPILERSGISTQAILGEGQSLLLGGLVVDNEFDDVDQVPVLGRVPVVGRAFRDTSRGSGRVERLFLISPRLVPLSQAHVRSPGEGDLTLSDDDYDRLRAGVLARSGVDRDPIRPIWRLTP